MRLAYLFFCATALVACGSAPAPRTDATRTDSTATGSETTTSVEASAEPCTGACSEGAQCRNARGWSCDCTLHADVNCGGAPRPIGPAWWAWSCAPPDPTADRGDGCPFTAPAESAPCEAAAQCRYAEGACGWNGTDATCDGSAWHLTSFALPPPP